MKFCCRCETHKDQHAFSRESRRKDGLKQYCKACANNIYKEWYQKNKDRRNAVSNDYYKRNKEQYLIYKSDWRHRNRGHENSMNAARRSLKRQATPSWSETEKIVLLYEKASEFGMHVDHVVPLKSKYVCGLHCWANLQLLGSVENISKGNKYWPDMPEELYG